MNSSCKDKRRTVFESSFVRVLCYYARMNPNNKRIREEYIANPNKCLACDDSILPMQGQRLFNVRLK